MAQRARAELIAAVRRELAARRGTAFREERSAAIALSGHRLYRERLSRREALKNISR